MPGGGGGGDVGGEVEWGFGKKAWHVYMCVCMEKEG